MKICDRPWLLFALSLEISAGGIRRNTDSDRASSATKLDYDMEDYTPGMGPNDLVNDNIMEELAFYRSFMNMQHVWPLVIQLGRSVV